MRVKNLLPYLFSASAQRCKSLHKLSSIMSFIITFFLLTTSVKDIVGLWSRDSLK